MIPVSKTIVTAMTLIAAGTVLFAQNSVGQPLASAIENEVLKATFISPGGLTLALKNSPKPFLTLGSLTGQGGRAVVTNVLDATFGSGQAIVVSYPDGGHDHIMLYPKLPFVLLRSHLQNRGTEPVIRSKVQTLSTRVELGKPASQLKTFGTGGLLAADKNPGSYVWLAAVEPQTRNGVVFGWMTQERGSGVLFSRVEGERVQVDALLEYGNLRQAPGQGEDLESLAIGYFEDARLGLETWAEAVAKVHKVRLKPQPTGYCTWYSKPHGGAADQEHLAQLGAFAATNLAAFGFTVVQIDDGWQSGFKRSSPSSPKKDFRTHNPRGPYPDGMKAAADHLKSLGLVPGIWFMPFAGTVGDPFFDAHPEWFAKTAEGKVYDTPWGGACLDMTHPGAREHLRSVVGRICGGWGYQYIKIDGLWTGTVTKQLYVNSGYKPDDLGEALLHDRDKTGIEAFRSGLKLVREAAGEKVFILGCNAPQNMRSYGGAFGLVDAMRVGPDNKAEWKSLLRGPTFGTRHYFLHRRIWYNDPDPVYVRDSMPLHHAQLICSWVALSGQLNLSSEWIPGLSPERLDILKRTMPSHREVARPVDLFEEDLPQIWTVAASGRTIIGLYNWDSKPKEFDVLLKQLGLDPKTEYAGFDFWANRLLLPFRERLRISVPAESCAVLAVRQQTAYPQVISTSRHVTQGMLDLSGEDWLEAAATLSGRSELVGKDPYELRILSDQPAKPAGIRLASADVAAGVTASFVSDGPLTRVRLESPTGRTVSWNLTFK